MALYSAGVKVVESFGPRLFVIAWIGAGVCSSNFSLLWSAYKTKRLAKKQKDERLHGGRGREIRSIGASGSIAGHITILACTSPYSTVQIGMVPIPMPFWMFSSVFAAGSVAMLAFDWAPSIDHAGHLGGMVFGGLLYFIALRRRLRLPRL